MNSLKYIVSFTIAEEYAKFCEEFDFQKVLDDVLKELRHRKA